MGGKRKIGVSTIYDGGPPNRGIAKSWVHGKPKKLGETGISKTRYAIAEHTSGNRNNFLTKNLEGILDASENKLKTNIGLKG